MSARDIRPIVPAPASRPRYPRVGAVWGAFAAGTLGVSLVPSAAHADCALPAHAGTVDPAASEGKTGDGTTSDGKNTKAKKPKVPKFEEPRPLPGRMLPPQPPGGEPMMVAPVTVEGKPSMVKPPDGGPPRVVPPQIETVRPMPGWLMPVAPVKPCKLPMKGAPTGKRPQLDGDVASVGAVRLGPDPSSSWTFARGVRRAA